VTTQELIIQAQALREGGHVQRCHTMPILGDASNARHCYNMAILLELLWPTELPAYMYRAVLKHDTAERWVGDTPAPAKYSIYKPLGKALREAEMVVEQALGIDEDLTLGEHDEAWLKGVDMLEYLMFCEDQLNLGNRNVFRSIVNVKAMLESPWVPDPIRQFARHYSWSRTADVVQGESMTSLDKGLR
jgi:hypothetical protein